jgi:pimeloyl-ACP methyl ester carboxylesterase
LANLRLHYNRTMSNQVLDRYWPRRLHRRPRLSKRIDSGDGPLVVLLHGIGRTAEGWQYLAASLQNVPVQVVAFDLLGFGNSPKPTWLDYTADDHAEAVINAIERLKAKTPAIIVGHSMGCLVAVRVGRRRPDLVRHLILYEMPLYKGLPNKRYYRLRLNFYNKIYNWIQRYEPTFNGDNVKLTDRLAQKFSDLRIDPENWPPYAKSLKNTIFEQTAPEDIPKLSMPMDVIYGRLDMLVIHGTVKHVTGADTGRLSIHTVRAGHRISHKASLFLRKRIIAALAQPVTEDKATVTK